MGIIRYYIRFIEVFSKFTYPIISIQNKLSMDNQVSRMFWQVKTYIDCRIFLNITNIEKEFFGCTNGCLEVLHGVLMQENYVVSYDSREWKAHERNYVVCDLEWFVVMHDLKMWRHCLLGKLFIVITDHIILKYFFTQYNFNAR